MTVKGQGSWFAKLENAGDLYTNTGIFEMLAPVDRECQGT